MVENNINKPISERISKLMEHNNATGYRIIKDSKIPSASFYKCMNDESEWKVEHLLRIAEYFHVSLDYLIKGESTDITELKEENKKLEEEKQQLYIEVTRLHKVAEAVREYNHIKQTGKGK